MDWKALFVPTIPLGEVFLRGSVIYLFLFAVFRIMRREAGALGMTDLLVVVLVADAVQNAMAGESRSLTEGALLVVTIAGWNFALDWLAFRFPGMRPVLHPPPLLLVKDGKVMRKSLRREMISSEELAALLREKGVDDVARVRRCYLESEGEISVIADPPPPVRPAGRRASLS